VRYQTSFPCFANDCSISTQFCEGDKSREKWLTLGLLKSRGLKAAAISLIAIEDFVIAEEFR
jgi:hypothetical protein